MSKENSKGREDENYSEDKVSLTRQEVSSSSSNVSQIEEIYKHCLETTTITAVQGYTPDGNIFFWNKASELLYGYYYNEVIEKNIKEILLPVEEWDSFNKTIQDIIQQGKPTEPQKWTMKTRIGEEKQVLSSMIPVKIKDLSYIFCMDVDITELIKTQDKLKESEQKYRTIIEFAHEGIWVVDEEFKTVFVNQKMADILGFSPEEMIGKSTLEFIPPEEYPDVQRQRADRIKGLSGQYERTLICADKSKRIFLVNASPIYDASNKFKGAIGLFSDITQRKEFETMLKREHDKLQEFLNLSPSLFIFLDKDGNVQYLNNTAYTVLKCDNSAIGKNWFSTFVKSSQRDTLQKHFEKIIKEQTTSDFEDVVYVTNTQNEERVLILRHAFLYGVDGAIDGLICSGMDITEKIQAEKERQAMEEKIRQTQRLESIGILAGGMAHDFNNLLVGIIGNADLALMEIPNDSPANYYLQEIIRISKELTHLSQQLLAYAGKGKTFVKPISLTELIKNIETLITLSISKKIAIKFDLDENLPLINADPAHIQQLIINLVLNAAEAIGDKSGVITIVTKHMHCDMKYWQTTYFGENCKEGTYIYLEIIDNGSGISKEVKDRMFEPFFTTKFIGRGLGLSAVAGIVRAHNGAIKVYTEIGKGTSFKVFFPAIEDTTTQSRSIDFKQEKSEQVIKQKQILVVDDEKLVRDTVKNMLEIGGLHVLLASNGEEAIKIYIENKDQIALVLLDMTMPIMDGEETFRELRRINPEVKVLLSSGYNEKDILERFIGKGLAGFIQKPYILSTLLETIKNIIKEP